jgi:DNA-binding NarL/FixJ family response regulator
VNDDELRRLLERAGVQAERLASIVRDALRFEAADSARPTEPTPIDQLTARERQVLDLVLEGLSSKEIAKRLGIARATARCHTQNTLTKLGVYNRAQAAALAVRSRYVSVHRDTAGGGVARSQPEIAARLTRREIQVLRCLAAGLGRAEIAERLFVSPHTARTHIQRLMAKLDVHSILGAMAAARKAGVTPLDAAST